MFDSFEHGQHKNRSGNPLRLPEKRCISKKSCTRTQEGNRKGLPLRRK